jgi:UrcA family protein
MFMETKRHRFTGILTTLLVAGAAFGMAQDSRAAEVRRERVSLAGLDLATPGGGREFDRRVSVAIRRVCEMPGATTHRTYRERVECRRKAREGVRLQLQARGIPATPLIARN